jgi:hypothetical protein
MIKATDVTWIVARKALENTYEGRATVTEHRKIEDKGTRLISYKDVVVLEDQPCKLSFSKITSTDGNGKSVKVSQVTKLFISPDVNIKPGSKIKVTQNGVTTDYTYSGIPAVYHTHQEFVLDIFGRWA